MKAKNSLFSLIVIMTAGVAAAEQVSIDDALHARLSGRPDISFQILTALEDESPLDAHVKFEKGVALAEMGRCGAALRSFKSGLPLARVSGYRRAMDEALADLCPPLAPWEFDFDLGFVAETNGNGGASSDTVTIGQTTFRLSDEALAQAGSHLVFFGRAGYNHQIDHGKYLTPDFQISGRLYEDVDKSDTDIAIGLKYRTTTDTHDFRLGPSFGFSFRGDDLESRNVGFGAVGEINLSPISALSYSASITRKDLTDVSGEDISRSGSLSYWTAIRSGQNKLKVTYAYRDTDAYNYMNDLQQQTLQVSLYGNATKTIGYETYARYTRVEGDHVDPFFRTKREDDIYTAGINLSFSGPSDLLGRPYIGVSHTRNESSFDTKDFDNTSLNAGFTKSF